MTTTITDATMPSTAYAIPVPAAVSVPIAGTAQRFPVRRVYCVGRNYVEHAKEMGFTGREPPFFFLKPGDTVMPSEDGAPVRIHYPPMTKDFHFEVELVVAIGIGGKNIAAADARKHIYGYAVGLDMTRRDLQSEMKKLGRPWCIGKAFDESAPIAAIVPAAQAKDVESAEIFLTVDGADRQRSSVAKLIWNIGEIIEHLSAAWELRPGDLIYTGTPEGVGPVKSGETMRCAVAGLPPLEVQVD